MTALVVAILIMQVRSARSERNDAQEALKAAQGEIVLLERARSADRHAAEVVSEARATIAKEEVQGRVATEAALAANPDWANQPIPADIIDSLRNE